MNWFNWFVDAVEGMPPRYLARWPRLDLYNDPEGASASWVSPPPDFEAGYVPVKSAAVPEDLRRVAHARYKAAEAKLYAAKGQQWRGRGTNFELHSPPAWRRTD